MLFLWKVYDNSAGLEPTEDDAFPICTEYLDHSQSACS